MESIVIINKCAEQENIQYTAHMFKGEALEWWNTLIMSKERQTMYNVMWEDFKEMVLTNFCLMHKTDQIQSKFLKHRVVGTNLREYNTKFHEYCRLVPQLVTSESSKVTRYIWGLRRVIRDIVRSHLPQTADSAMELASYLMNGLIRNKEEDKKVVPSDDHKKTRGARFKGKGVEQQKSGFNSNYTQCKFCMKYHKGKCHFALSTTTTVCDSCHKPGHTTADCRKKSMTCYNCK
ncbi:uncharacterized protein LOC143596025 [Bidens hawaiensis]|uniref:uncharacterized protein LOC143596025 n=1 Tax=Bidens hawaiensis TaxID=980011 RepID=UPI00404ACB37